MKCSLGISNFLEEISSLSHSVLFLYFFALMAEKDFLSDQCKEIEGNNRMGETRGLFKKIRDTKGTFHAKMGTIKDRNCMDLTKAEDIEKWQESTEELCKKDLHHPDNEMVWSLT